MVNIELEKSEISILLDGLFLAKQEEMDYIKHWKGSTTAAVELVRRIDKLIDKLNTYANN